MYWKHADGTSCGGPCEEAAPGGEEGIAVMVGLLVYKHAPRLGLVLNFS
jgi:hypothetical protein